MINRPPAALNLSILYPLTGKRNPNEETYLQKIQDFERECELSLIETLSRLSIQATVKTDPYSLPYQEEIIVPLYGESYLNGPYEFHRVVKQIVKHLLTADVSKIRFYFFINVLPCYMMGKVEYRFRYFTHS